MGLDKIAPIREEMTGRLAELNLELVDIEYRRESKAMILRIIIDREDGVNLDACTAASRAVKELVDVQDIPYDHMEVSSPGLDRVLHQDRDFARFRGSRIKVKTVKDYQGPRTTIGLLQDFNAENIIVQVQDEEHLAIPRNMISIIRLHPDY